MITSKNVLKNQRTPQFIGELGVTVRWSSIDGSDETVQLSCSRPILMKRSDEAMSLCIMKWITSPPLDHDPTLRMHSRALNLNCYNDSFKTRALDGDPVDHEST